MALRGNCFSVADIDLLWAERRDVGWVDDVSRFRCEGCAQVAIWVYFNFKTGYGNRVCPDCCDGSETKRQRAFYWPLFEARATCPNRKLGCSYLSQLKHLGKHLKTCELSDSKMQSLKVAQEVFKLKQKFDNYKRETNARAMAAEKERDIFAQSENTGVWRKIVNRVASFLFKKDNVDAPGESNNPAERPDHSAMNRIRPPAHSVNVYRFPRPNHFKRNPMDHPEYAKTKQMDHFLVNQKGRSDHLKVNPMEKSDHSDHLKINREERSHHTKINQTEESNHLVMSQIKQSDYLMMNQMKLSDHLLVNQMERSEYLMMNEIKSLDYLMMNQMERLEHMMTKQMERSDRLMLNQMQPSDHLLMNQVERSDHLLVNQIERSDYLLINRMVQSDNFTTNRTDRSNHFVLSRIKRSDYLTMNRMVQSDNFITKRTERSNYFRMSRLKRSDHFKTNRLDLLSGSDERMTIFEARSAVSVK